jgi:hypothetical protein
MKLIKRYNLLKRKLKYVTDALTSGTALIFGNTSLNVFELVLLESKIKREISVIEGIEING